MQVSDCSVHAAVPIAMLDGLSERGTLDSYTPVTWLHSQEVTHMALGVSGPESFTSLPHDYLQAWVTLGAHISAWMTRIGSQAKPSDHDICSGYLGKDSTPQMKGPCRAALASPYPSFLPQLLPLMFLLCGSWLYMAHVTLEAEEMLAWGTGVQADVLSGLTEWLSTRSTRKSTSNPPTMNSP